MAKITSTDVFKMVAEFPQAVAEGKAVEDIITDEMVEFAQEFLAKRAATNAKNAQKNAAKRAASGLDAKAAEIEAKLIKDLTSVIGKEPMTRDDVLAKMGNYTYKNVQDEEKALSVQKISTVLAKAEAQGIVKKSKVLCGEKLATAYTKA